jgi:hypothetical protein
MKAQSVHTGRAFRQRCSRGRCLRISNQSSVGRADMIVLFEGGTDSVGEPVGCVENGMGWWARSGEGGKFVRYLLEFIVTIF